LFTVRGRMKLRVYNMVNSKNEQKDIKKNRTLNKKNKTLLLGIFQERIFGGINKYFISCYFVYN